MMRNDTIAAVATPAGRGALAVIRLSGTAAGEIASRLTGRTVETLPSGKPLLARVIDWERGSTLDRCVVTSYRGPRTYTGEDVVEISCHGSRPVIKRIMELITLAGARPAAGGEFTMRAVLNGKMDLTQAEAVNALVRSETLLQAEIAVGKLEGLLARQMEQAGETLLNLVARMEAEIDFPEEGITYLTAEGAAAEINEVLFYLRELIESFRKADMARGGARVVIAGNTNVGKSTLFNALLERERSIVDRQPGTTRDFISETIEMQGIPVTLVDTAGIRIGADGIEIEGIRKARAQIGEADLVVLMTDIDGRRDGQEENLAAWLETQGIGTIRVLNKVDKCASREIHDRVKSGSLPISALEGTGLDGLKSRIASDLGLEEFKTDRTLITELRQQQLIKEAHGAISRAKRVHDEGGYEELVVEELRQAVEALKQITGKGGSEESLRRIFENFCIGK